MRRLPLILVILAAVCLPASAQESGWAPYRHPDLGFTIDLPLGQFEFDETDAAVTRLRHVEADALLEVYGGHNSDRLGLQEFIDFLSRADRIADITYQAAGRTWFVISGYYRREQPGEPFPIFYAKFMFTPDLERFSAFEISYPESERQQLAPVVEALEASLRPPSMAAG